jgi:Family of unknown function (DUF5752)
VLEFAIKDCALAVIATGRRAQTLRELRNVLRDVHPGSIYHHFWGTLLRPQPADREYNNDFATWCFESLHDAAAAERLAVIDPVKYANIEDLRRELIEVMDERLDETELMLFTRGDQQFHFARSVIVVFDTHKVLSDPRQLMDALPQMSVGSIFYHFVDARRREPSGRDDFQTWLSGLGPGYAGLIELLTGVDPYFESLFVLRDRLAGILAQHFGVASASSAGEPVQVQTL